MSSFLFDLRVAARRLLAARGSTLVAIVTLSIGIGTVSTMYALFSAATDDLPRVPDADRIARVYISDPTASEGRIPPAAAEWKTWLEAPPARVTLAVIDDAEARLDAGARAGTWGGHFDRRPGDALYRRCVDDSRARAGGRDVAAMVDCTDRTPACHHIALCNGAGASRATPEPGGRAQAGVGLR